MPVLSREDNRKLFESNLPEELKHQIASFNELIITFLKETFKDYEGFEKICNEIIERLKITEYKISDKINSKASFEYNDTTKKYKFIINGSTIDMYSSEEGLIGIYFHEFFHLISNTLKAKIGTRMEEGMADLFSDMLVDYFNRTFAKKEILKPKDSNYEIPASIVRSAIISTNPEDLLWQYLTDINKLKETYKNTFGLEASDLIFMIEEKIGNSKYINEQEERYISEAIKKIKVSSLPSICIMRNTIIGKIICEKIEKSGLSEEQVKKQFPNIPEMFFKDNKFIFSDINKRRIAIINNDSLDEKSLNELLNFFLAEFDTVAKDPNKKIGIYNNYTIDLMLYLLNHSKCYNVESVVLVPIFYAYNLIYNGSNYNEQGVLDILKLIGFNETLQSELYKTITSKAKTTYEAFKQISKEEAYQKIRSIISREFKSNIKIQAFQEQLKTNRIAHQKHLNKLIENIQNLKIENIYTPTSLLREFISQFIKERSKNIKLSIQSFDKVKQTIDSIIKQLEITCEMDVSSLILHEWNPENVSIIDVIEIVSHFGLPDRCTGDYFDDIKIRGISELEKNINVESAIRYINAVNTPKYQDASSFNLIEWMQNFDYTESTKQIKQIMKSFVIKELRSGNKTLKEKVDAEDRNLLYFCKDMSGDAIKETDKDILKKVFGKETTVESYSFLFESEFQIETYNALKENPHLAAMYISHYLPNGSPGFVVNLTCAIDDFNQNENAFLKNEYKTQVQEIIKKILSNDYDPGKDNLYGSCIDYELKLLKQDLNNIVDNETKTKLISKVINICNIKIPILLNPETETYQQKTELLERIKKGIEEVISQTQNQIVKVELEKTLENLKSYSFEGATK